MVYQINDFSALKQSEIKINIFKALGNVMEGVRDLLCVWLNGSGVGIKYQVKKDEPVM